MVGIKNSEIARNLKGHLALITGDIDNNVHPSNTYRLADALIKANKRFDMWVLPGQRHGFTTAGDYVSWLRADYFARYLLGDFDQSVDMWEINAKNNRPKNRLPAQRAGARSLKRSSNSSAAAAAAEPAETSSRKHLWGRWLKARLLGGERASSPASSRPSRRSRHPSQDPSGYPPSVEPFEAFRLPRDHRFWSDDLGHLSSAVGNALPRGVLRTSSAIVK